MCKNLKRDFAILEQGTLYKTTSREFQNILVVVWYQRKMKAFFIWTLAEQTWGSTSRSFHQWTSLVAKSIDASQSNHQWIEWCSRPICPSMEPFSRKIIGIAHLDIRSWGWYHITLKVFRNIWPSCFLISRCRPLSKSGSFFLRFHLPGLLSPWILVIFIINFDT